MQGSSTFCRNALLRITMVNSLLNPFIFSHEENCSLEFWPVAKVLHQINCRNDKQCIISTDIQVTVLILQCKCMFQILWVGRNVHIDQIKVSKILGMYIQIYKMLPYNFSVLMLIEISLQTSISSAHKCPLFFSFKIFRRIWRVNLDVIYLF